MTPATATARALPPAPTPAGRPSPRLRVALRALALAAILSLSGCRPATTRTSLLLITIDTLRADHLPSYAYPLPTAPRISSLAARGIVFESFLSPVPETGPSCAAMLTGLWPAELGIRGNSQPLGPGPATAAEVLRSAGYETAAFVSGYPLVRRLSGLDRGFDHFDDEMPDPRGRAPRVQRAAVKTTGAVLDWLGARSRSRPFFLWVHYYDVHGDYAPGPPYETMFRTGPGGPFLDPRAIPDYQRRIGETDAAAYIARYDGEIRRVDDQIGRLIDGLETRGELARTLVVLTADHGESLTENGYYFDHGNELYLSSLHIPLILSGHGVPSDGRRIAGPAQVPDLLPTILDLLGIPAPGGVRGMSLVSAIAGRPLEARETFAEARFKPYRALTPTADTGPKLAARDERFTVILRLASRRLEIYDRLDDPGETSDLAAGGDDLAGGPPADRVEPSLREELERGLLARLDGLTAGTSAPPPAISPETRRALEALAARRRR